MRLNAPSFTCAILSIALSLRLTKVRASFGLIWKEVLVRERGKVELHLLERVAFYWLGRLRSLVPRRLRRMPRYVVSTALMAIMVPRSTGKWGMLPPEQ